MRILIWTDSQWRQSIEQNSLSTTVERACGELAAANRDYQRTRRRRFAATYRRDIRILLSWTFPDSRDAVTMAEIHPESPPVTKVLCRRLYRDYHDAHALPRFFRRRAMRIDALRDLLSGECRLYIDQRARANAQTAMNGFLNSLAAE